MDVIYYIILIILYYIILYCVVLCCVVLCCVVLCCVVSCRVVSCRVVSYRIVLYYINKYFNRVTVQLYKLLSMRLPVCLSVIHRTSANGIIVLLYRQKLYFWCCVVNQLPDFFLIHFSITFSHSVFFLLIRYEVISN